ncbi:hypothetical protein F4678DRAFT_485946 [Xylaria arbuscula]|nr:hypothetical protein F4678DRAFT_485946 [Xylaria arbuscula]
MFREFANTITLSSSKTRVTFGTAIFSPEENPIDYSISTEQNRPFYARKRTPPQANTPFPFPNMTPKNKTRSLDDLPLEIMVQIWKYVAETPSWFHVKHGPEHAHPITVNLHREHWVNRTWYFAAEFRASLTHHPIQYFMYHYAKRILDANPPHPVDPRAGAMVGAASSMLKWSNINTGYRPFTIRLEGVPRSPIVRPTVDWFFLENYMTALSSDDFEIRARMDEMPHGYVHDLHRISTVVLKLEDIYTSLCRALNSSINGVVQESWRVDRVNSVNHFNGVDVEVYLSKMSTIFGPLSDHNTSLEKCMILISELRPSVQPLDLQEISVKAECFENSFSTDTQREVIISHNVSSNDRAMISFVHQELENFVNLQREWRNLFLRSPHAQDHLAFVMHRPGHKLSKWLATIDGRIWREKTDEGKAWQQTESGHWWLASVRGSPWLETPNGLEWLDSDAGAAFLSLPMALATDKGRAWIAENCPDYRVPVAPEPPREIRVGLRGLTSAMFFTRPPPHWAFVMAPVKVEDESK